MESGQKTADAAAAVSKPLVIEAEAEFDLFEAYDNYENQRKGLGQDFFFVLKRRRKPIAFAPSRA